MSNSSSAFSLAIKTNIRAKIIKVIEHVRIISLITNVKKNHSAVNDTNTTTAECFLSDLPSNF